MRQFICINLSNRRQYQGFRNASQSVTGSITNGEINYFSRIFPDSINNPTGCALGYYVSSQLIQLIFLTNSNRRLFYPVGCTQNHAKHCRYRYIQQSCYTPYTTTFLNMTCYIFRYRRMAGAVNIRGNVCSFTRFTTKSRVPGITLSITNTVSRTIRTHNAFL